MTDIDKIFQFLFDPILTYDLESFHLDDVEYDGGQLLVLVNRMLKNSRIKCEQLDSGFVSTGLAKLSYVGDCDGYNLAQFTIANKSSHEDMKELIKELFAIFWYPRQEDSMAIISCKVLFDNFDNFTDGKIWSIIDKELFLDYLDV